MNLLSWVTGDNGPASTPAVASQTAVPPGPAADADQNPNANAGARPRPAPVDARRMVVDDDDKWRASKNRWNLAIRPDSDAFVQQRRVFEAALDPGSGQSIDDILHQHFAGYEILKFSGYAERARDPELYEQQKRDAAAYTALLTRPPWDQQAPNAFLAFKMTLLYFGFSVEPMKMTDFFRLPSGAGLFGLDDDDGELDDNRTFIPEEMRPLRFLNNYDSRSYGADNGHMMPDPTYELFYGLPFQPFEGQQKEHGGAATGAQTDVDMRGRGLGEDEGEGEDLMSDGSVDGASFTSEFFTPDAPDDDDGEDGVDSGALNLRGGAGTGAGAGAGAGAAPEDLVQMLSFSANVTCRLHFARSFYAAVDTALVLENRRDIRIAVALLRLPANQPAEVAQIVRGMLGHEGEEKNLYNQVLKAHTDARHNLAAGTRLALFVCPTRKETGLTDLLRDSQAVATRGSPGESHETIELARLGTGGERSGAYLWVPGAVTKHTASNHYEKWFKTVVQIASGPHDLADGLGREKAQLPAPGRHFTLSVGDIGTSFHADSPVPREVWEQIITVARQNAAQQALRLQLTAVESQAYAHVPGYLPPNQATRAVSDLEAVFTLAWDSVPAAERASVSTITVRAAGSRSVARFGCTNGSVDRGALSWTPASGRVRGWLRGRLLLTVVPQWEQYEATIPTSVAGYSPEAITLDNAVSWEDARRLIEEALTRTGNVVGNGNNVIRIDQRTATGQGAQDALHKNRTSWDFETSAGTGTAAEMNELWREFQNLVSVRRFEIKLEEKFAPDGSFGVGNPLGSDGLEQIWDRWGCNRPSLAVDDPRQATTTTKTNTTMAAATTIQPHYHHQNTQPQINDHDHQQHGQAQNQGVDQVVPNLGTSVDTFQSGKFYREMSYALPMSVQVADQPPSFPINAPALEQIRRPRAADGLVADSMPIVSTQIMTPTEQRTLQQDFFQMRSIALNRGQRCPHRGCNAYFPLGPNSSSSSSSSSSNKNMAAFHDHLDREHIGNHCPFCSETLFSYWSDAQRRKHFVDNHSEFFTAKGDLLRESMLAQKTQSKGNVHRREEQWSFCARCGRNHQLLTSKADRVHHDNTCYPGNEATVPTADFCRRCGQPDHVLVRTAGATSTRQPQQHQCAAAASDGHGQASHVFCPHCALAVHDLPPSYGRRHLLNCKAPGSRADSWCPWCGIDLKSAPPPARLKHLAACALRPASGQNPLDTDSGIPYESPRDRAARTLVHGLSDLGRGNRASRIAVPPTCPVDGCAADLRSWNAHGLYAHFQTHPGNTLQQGGGLKSCPFCSCDFELRGWTTSLEKQQHLNDHLEQRTRRVLADELIGSLEDRESNRIRDAILTRNVDEFDQQAEISRLTQENVQQAESIKHLTTENRRLRVVTPSRPRRQVRAGWTEGPVGGASGGATIVQTTLPSAPIFAQSRTAARVSRVNDSSSSSRTPAPGSKRRDGDAGGLAGPPAKKSRYVQQNDGEEGEEGEELGEDELDDEDGIIDDDFDMGDNDELAG